MLFYYTIEEAANYCGCSSSEVADAISTRKLRAHVRDNNPEAYIDRVELAQWNEQRLQVPA